MIRIREIDGPMPFDRWDSATWQLVHATGREWFDERQGIWCVEYEDSITADLPETE